MRGIYQDPKDKITLHRYNRRVSTFHRMLEEKLFTPSEIRAQCFDARFICVPKFDTCREVRTFDRKVERARAEHTLFGETLYKIPSLVNDIEGYVESLLYKHYGWE